MDSSEHPATRSHAEQGRGSAAKQITCQDIAHGMFLVHTVGGRVPFPAILQSANPLLPTSDDEDYCSNACRRAERQFDISPSVYFYAGRAHPSFGDVVLAYNSQWEYDRDKRGCATPFDMGGIAANLVETDLRPTRVATVNCATVAALPCCGGVFNGCVDPIKGFYVLAEELIKTGKAKRSDKLSLLQKPKRGRWQVFNATEYIAFSVGCTGDASSPQIFAYLPSEDELNGFVSASRIEREMWRKSFAEFIGKHFGTPMNYFDTEPNGTGEHDVFRLNEDWRAWTYEVRVHEPVEILECAAWAGDEDAAESIEQAIGQMDLGPLTITDGHNAFLHKRIRNSNYSDANCATELMESWISDRLVLSE